MNRIAAFSLAFAICAVPAFAQQQAEPGTGAVLRVLDKVGGGSTNYELNKGTQVEIGALTVALRECRYPAGNPNGEAYAYLDIQTTATAEQVFSGWMVASSPALNAMEHSRYDVWVLRCKTS